MNFDSSTILKWIVQVIGVGGSSAVVAYGLFKWLGQKWLESQFATQLEKLKHQQQKELERVRHEIQTMFSRISKIHAKEFEVLPQAWFMLHEAHGSVYDVIAKIKFLPTFRGMPQGLFEQFLESEKRISPFHKQELREAHDRDGYYRKIIADIGFDDAAEKYRILNNYLIQNRIFMTSELKAKFNAVADALSRSLALYEVGKQAKDPKMQFEAVEQISALNDKISDVERAVQERLRYEEA